MLDHLPSILSQDCRLRPDRPLLLGVSGGADSLCLLDVLKMEGYAVVVAHFHHHLRPQADHDAQTVERLAAGWGLPFIFGEGSTAEYAAQNNLSIEEAARELRYRFLFQQAEAHGAQAVAVAHNADDQVETVLMHLLRGAGLDGLAGMPYVALPNPWSAAIPLARPLLGVWRAEIEAYCAQNGLAPVEDATNADTTYFRNRLRHELLPALETYIPGVRARLWQTAELLAADRALLDQITAHVWDQALQDAGDGFIFLRLPTLNRQAVALQRRLIRSAIAHLRPAARDADFAMIQRALEFAVRPAFKGPADLGLGLRISREGERLLISDWDAQLPGQHWPQITERLTLTIPGEADLGYGWILKAEVLADVAAARRESVGNRDPYRAWIDLGERQPLLSLRPRRPGERFQPLGMAGQSQKLSDFMINQKIPRRARDAWPLVCVGDEIAWIPGHRPGEAFRLTDQTSRGVFLMLARA